MAPMNSTPFDYERNFVGYVASVELDTSAKNLLVTGKITAADLQGIARISAYILPLYVDEFFADYSRLHPFGCLSENLSYEFRFETPLASLRDIDSRYGEVFSSKVAVVAQYKNGTRLLVDYAKFLSNPEALAENTEPLPERKSVKGVGLLIPSDLEQLGVQYTTINVLLWNMLTISDHGENSIPYSFEGETYFFKKSYIHMIDNVLTTCEKNHISVIAILIMKGIANDDPDSPARYYAHADAENAVDLIAVDMRNLRSVQYYKAIISFLAKRYSRKDQAYGRFVGYIVGNEIGTTTAWNYMGVKTLHEYVDQYCRWLRLTNVIVKSVYANARVYASFDHFWNRREIQPDFISFRNNDVFDALIDLSKRQGNFGWNIAWHPYPQDIFKIDTWNDPDCKDSFDTEFITFKNLQVLSRYLQKPENTYRGEMRRIILSEQGFTSSDNSPEHQTLQAAAYAYAYYKVLMTPGVDVFSMNGHVDNGAEMGLKLGLWTNKPGTVNQAYQQKPVYNVFKYIDTVKTLEVSAFALDVIGKSIGKPISNWKEVIPEFDAERIRSLCGRPVVWKAPLVGEAESTAPKIMLSQKPGAHWEATDDTGLLTLEKDPVTGRQAYQVSILSNLYDTNIPKDYKGMTLAAEKPLNLLITPVVSAQVKVTGIGEGEKADFLLRAYSGDRIAESEPLTGEAETWNTISADLSKWKGLTSIDRIKIWVRPHEDVNLLEGTVSVCGLQAFARPGSGAKADKGESGND